MMKQQPKWNVVVDDDLSHAEVAADFLQREFCPPGSDPMWSPEYLRWKLGGLNPGGRGYCSLAVHEGKIVGIVTLAARPLWINGRLIRGGEVGDTYTAAAFRRKGIAAAPHPSEPEADGYLNRFVFGRLATETRERAEREGFQLIYGTPNMNALPGWTKRLGYRLPAALSPYRRVRPTAKALSARMRLGASLSRASLGIDRMMAKLAGTAYGLSAERYAFCVEEVDDLWLRARSQYAFSVVRNGAWFAYRYTTHPLARYEFHAVRSDGRLCALVVTRRMRLADGHDRLFVADWMSDRSLRSACTRLTFSMASISRDWGLHSISGWFPTREPLLLLGGFVERGRQPIIVRGDADLEAQIDDMAPQDFPLGFSDNI